MGGEDWQMWIDALDEAGVLADGAKTTAFTYIGEKITWDLYWDGTIGQAKKDLDKRVISIREKLAAKGGDARVSVLKAVVTQASSAIPIMPLYLAMLFKEMKKRGTHEAVLSSSIDCLPNVSITTHRALTMRVACVWMSWSFCRKFRMRLPSPGPISAPRGWLS